MPFRFAVSEARLYKKVGISARFICLFMCAVFASTLFMPVATIYAESTKGKTQYPGALQASDSGVKLAGDAKKGAFDTSQDAPLSGDTGDGPGVKQKPKHEEVVSKRTQNTKTFDLGNGKLEVRNYMGPVHYKEDGKWKQIDTSLVEDTNAAESTNWLGEGLAWVKGKTQSLHTYKVKANDWQAKFAASDDNVGMVRVEAGGKKISFSPRGATAGVVPDVQKNDQGVETVTYKDLWSGVDIVYSVKNEMLKEEIVLKNASATTDFSYDTAGANLTKNKAGGFDIDGTTAGLSELSVTLQRSGPTSEKVISQDVKDGVLQIKLDKDWLAKQSSDQFPVVIDPTYTNGPAVSWNYTAYKSDGYVCSSSSCYMNAGELYDNGWKNWRTVFCPGSMSFLSGKVVTWAGMYLQQANRSYLVGYNGNRYYSMQHASYFGYNGIDGASPGNYALINYNGYIDMTAGVRFEANRADWGACWSLWGEEYAATTWKGFDADVSYMHYEYSTTPATPTVVTPQQGQTFVDPQVSFQVNPVGDLDGDPVQYYFRIATGVDGETGTVINSGDQNSTQWTVPDGVLQDGMTYYLHVYSRDPYGYSGASQAIQFKVDSRRGKDKTQTYDTVGPVSVDLTNGNVSTSASSHDTTALGGSLGVSLDYNSPLRSRQGLVGTYWNSSNQSGSPVLTRVDKNVQFNWDTGSPSFGLVNTDNFSARWTGYFVAPTAGTFYFGGSNDDGMTISVNNQVLYNQGCYTGICYDTTKSVTLSAGQVVPIQVDYAEATGPAYANMYVKGAVGEQAVPQQWLQTGARPISQPHGLTGSYYASNSGYNLDASDKQLLVKRVDPVLSFNWGTAGPVPGANGDFMARFSGYVTLPTGDYVFGTNADDGAKIKIGDTTVVDNYNNGCCAEKYGASYHYNASTYPIQIDYYDAGGPASFMAMVKVNGAVSGQVLPTSWLSPSAQVLPAGWQLGIDPDGDISYDHLSANASTVTLSDSSGDTHVYTWTGTPGSTTGGGYKPPVNEDGQLTRNSDGTYTLIDTDGRTYVFNADGTLQSVTNPVDDRKPAALRYTYSGTPAHITQISDGVDGGRYARVYYNGDGQNQCAATPDASYISANSDALAGFICAVKTNDGRTSNFFYANFSGTPQLALIQKPGDERTSYQYDGNGMMTAIRDTLAEDAVAYGTRANDVTTLTQITYDSLGRATGVTAPAPTATAIRQQQTFEYGPITTTGSYTKEHVVGDAEPNGYTRRVDYDSIFRTTVDTDVTGNATTQVWDTVKDLLYSSTDATGLRSTTIYDADDRPTDSYGPAPSAWFGTDNRPLAAYVSQVPRTSSGYDEGINGLAVSWLDYKSANGGALTGAPKLHTTGFDPANRSRMSMDSANTALAVIPATKSPDAQGVGFRATGKLVVPNTGSYTFTACHDDALRLTVNDNLAIDDWNYVGASKCSTSAAVSLTAGTFVRFSLDYANADNAAYAFSLNLSGPVSTTGADWGSMLKPDYGLQTSQTVYGAPTSAGATVNQVSATTYGANPEYGLAQSASTDATGLNLTATSTYETPGAGYLRQTSSSLPGGATTNYAYYATTKADGTPADPTVNPCDATKSYREGGMLRLKTEPDPDGAGPQTGRTTETVYDDAGKVVATRYNSDPWTCTTYDSRERVLTTAVPAYNGSPARTITNNYLVGGNPLITSSSDASGTITVETDLLGRNVRYTDAKGNVTTNTYDNQGHLTQRISPLGTETFVYDQFDRLTDQKLDGIVYAHVTYDTYSRIDNVTYPAAGQQKVTYARDTLGRLNGLTYNGATPATGPAFNNVRALSNGWAAENVISAAGANYDGTPTNPNMFTLTGLTASYDQTKSTQFSESVDSGAQTGNGIQTRVSYDFTGDGTWDRVETYNYFATDNISGNQTYTQAAGLKSATGNFADLQNGTVKVEVWSAIGSGQSTVYTPTTATTPQASTVTLPYGTGAGSSNVTIASDQVTRAVTGDIVSGTELGQAKNYSYDSAGRLVGATVAGNSYTYGYGTQDASCASLPGANVNAGKDSNRTSQTVNGVTSTFCYDQADRLIASSDSKYTGAVYDTHGNTTQLGSGTTTKFTYDSSDRNVGIAEGTKTVTYTRDVQGRIISRSVVNGSTTVSNYGFTASGETPDFVTDASNNMVEKYLTLPGNVLLTIRPSGTGNAQKTYSLPNIHGDIFATTDASGTVIGVFQTGPFGEPITGQTTPNNTATGSTFGYVGQHEKITETEFSVQFIQMGARIYIPSLGRFASVDPIQGGTPNNYVYPTDPVNDFDLTGQFGWKAVANIASFASMLPGPAGMIASGVAAVAYAAAGDKKQAALACAGIALAAVGAGGAVVAYKAAKDAKAITTVARLGQLQKFNAGENRMITGFSKHALGRMAGTRGGPQMSPQAVKYIVAVGKKSYNVKHDSWNYSHWLGSVSLSPQGRIKTVIAKSRYARYIR